MKPLATLAFAAGASLAAHNASAAPYHGDAANAPTNSVSGQYTQVAENIGVNTIIEPDKGTLNEYTIGGTTYYLNPGQVVCYDECYQAEGHIQRQPRNTQQGAFVPYRTPAKDASHGNFRLK